MALYDLHIHTNFSHDIRDNYTIMERAMFAKQQGLSGIAITDHFDFYPACRFFNAENPKKLGEIDLDAISERKSEILEAKEKLSKQNFEVFYGIELGGQIFSSFSVIEKLLGYYGSELDIVLGSVHVIHSGFSFPSKDAFESASDSEIMNHIEIYLEDLAYHSKHGVGEVFTHCNFPERYVYKYERQESIDYSKYDDAYIEIFKNIIDRGIALEVNTAGYSYNDNPYMLPDARLLSVYKSLGGELVTIGSDAHSMDRIGDGVYNAAELLKSLGFKYQFIYRNRSPIAVAL